jgi:endonuclease I
MDGSGGGSNPSDTTDPVISGVAASASISQGSSYDPWDGITASDDTDGNITANITLEVLDESMTEVTGYGDFSGLSAGLYHLNYSVSDAAGNTATETLNLSIVGTSGDNPSSPDAPTITMASNFEYLAEQNSSWTDQGCTANDPEDGSVSCTLDSGSVDTSTLGTYILSYSATDSDLNTTTVSVSVDVLEDLSLLSIDLDPYYDSAEGLYGEALLLALRTIINNGFNGVTYGDSRYMLDDTDQDPNNPSNLILVYYLTSIDGTWDSGATWNREHVWPQSLLGVDASNGTVNIASDLHNLKPADPGENSSRSNKYFDTVETSSSYAPPTESQGDIARILFYMIVMYDHLSLVNTEPSVYEMGKLDTLIEWYYSDPVDTFESNRNDVIYSYQDNRNPFIDYEHFLELIYWDNTTVTGAN